MKCSYISIMDIGPRPVQQDCILSPGKIFQEDRLFHKADLSDDHIVLAVCDGMGGHVDGEKASHYTCEKLLEMLTPEKIHVEGINSVVSAIQKKSERDLTTGCGTTVAGLAIKGKKAFCFNMGDSRVYRLNSESIDYISHDHSLVQDLIDKEMISEVDAFGHPYRNVVHFGTGPAFSDVWDTYTPYIKEISLSEVSYFLICSDGVSDMLNKETLHRILGDSPLRNGQLLLEKIKEQTITDNISFIILKVEL